MTKNLRELSNALLGKFLDPTGKPVSGKLSSPSNLQEEIESLKQLVPGNIWRSPSNARVFEFMHEDSYCQALTLSLSDEDLTDLKEQSENTIQPIEIPGSIYLFLANQLNLQVKNNDPQLVDEYIAAPAEEDGVDLDVIKPLLEDITVLRLTDSSIFKNPTPGRYVANYICTFDPKSKGSNKLTSRSLEIIREIFLQEKDRLIEENLFEAMATPLLRHAFLEIYRILEFVFTLPRATSLLEQLRLAGGKIEIKILDFARHCHKQLGWNRIERDSIKKLFREYSSVNYSAFLTLSVGCSPFSTITIAPQTSSEEERVVYVEKIADRVYQLRNQVAHQFWPDEMVSCTDADWQELIEFTLGCISYFYNQHLSKSI
ncbi:MULTISPECIES: hypothetical protein [unclassified Variovorax]|nr:hypothetical protein SAMN03159371_00396 [Variovorax sp. NFACC28]SEF61202.1 hypothetical protein SAMN03159365_00422 [Variovorax sp. NFACC29]SFB72678.1 hypothetical protein SAMN03159379_00421 [Variovorax sp. NFACC26]SFG56575.1 hypothetical protein SAMN03159447_03884 [Variovorax sp. NFACC27]